MWDGGSLVDSNWRTAENWAGDVAPQPGDQLQFAGALRTTAHNDFPAGTSFQSIDFTAAGFVLEGNDVALRQGVSLDSNATAATIALNAALDDIVTIDVADGGTLTVSGSISGGNFLTKTGPGTLALAGTNSYTGGTRLDAGTILVQSDAALVQCSNGFLLTSPSATLDLNGHNATIGQFGLLQGTVTNTSATAATLSATTYVVLSGTIDVPLADASMLKATEGAVTLCPDAWNPILTGAGADIRGGKLVFDYTGSTSPAATVKSLLTYSYDNNLWDQGQFHSSGIDPTMCLGWNDDTTAHAVTVMYTVQADANLDGAVNLLDLHLVQANFGRTNLLWSDGDFNYDDSVNLLDLGCVTRGFNQFAADQSPQVLALGPLGSAETTADTVQFVAVFSKPVTGVDAGDFELQCSGTSGTIASVTPCGSTGIAYLVTVENVLGHGTLGLNLLDNDSVFDTNEPPLPLVGIGTDDGAFTGDVYTMTGSYAWDGGGENGNWSNPANWVGDVLPPAGSDLRFVGTPSEKGCVDDLDGTAFHSIEFSSDGFLITGTTPLALTGGITVHAGVASATISMTVTTDDALAIDVADADSLLTIEDLSGSGDLAKGGSGTLALNEDTHTGDTDVTAGALAVGTLPSVFPVALPSGIEFNTLVSSSAVVGNPGDSAGTFTWDNPTLPGGTLSLDSTSGILQWTPSGASLATDSSLATVTYTYAGGHQVAKFPIEVKKANVAPAFDFDRSTTRTWSLWNFHNTTYFTPSINVDIDNVVTTSFPAYDHEGSAIQYSLSGDLPRQATIDSAGNFSCHLSIDDLYHIYDFYVKATDSAGLYDLKHVLLPVNMSLAYDQMAATSEAFINYKPYSVAVDSVDNLLGAGANSELFSQPYYYRNVALVIDTQPAHAPNLTAGATLGQVLYTPNSGYQGLDSFRFHYEYDRYYAGNFIGHYHTNTATSAIQVGNWVSLVPHMTANDVDQAELKAPRTDTATLTLQNPRGDGVPCTGVWSLCFDRNAIRVYGPNGKEILPNSQFFETIAGYGTKKIELKVVGISANAAYLDADWSTSDCEHNKIIFNGQLTPWSWGTSTNAAFSIFDVDIDSDNDSIRAGLAPDDTLQEEYLEDNPYGLGRIIIPNWGDADSDGVLDCWDGFGTFTYMGHENDLGGLFTAITIQIPAQIDPATATIQFDYDIVGAEPFGNTTQPIFDGSKGRIRIWTKDGSERRSGYDICDIDPATSGDLVPSSEPFKVTDLGAPGSTVTLYIEGVVEANYVHNYASVKAHDRPTNTIVVKLNPGNGGAMVSDTIQYIVADMSSFYYLLQTKPELRAALASEGIYGREDLKKYCMHLLSFDELKGSTGGFGFTSVDASWLNCNDPGTGFGAGVYHDYIDGNSLLTFKGTVGWMDWVNNVDQALFPPAEQYTNAMTIAKHLREIWDSRVGPLPSILTPTSPGNWQIAGHSLGGGLAAAASVVSRFQASTFNAAGVNYLTVQKFSNDNSLSLGVNSQAQLQTKSQLLVTSYVVDGEILNYFQDNPSMIAVYVSPAAYLLVLVVGTPPQSIGTRVTLDSHQTILLPLPIIVDATSLYQRYTLHSYFIESLLLYYGFALS